MELASGLGLLGPDLRELERGERDRGGAGPVGGGGACASIREPLLGFWSAKLHCHGSLPPPTEQALVGGFCSEGAVPKFKANSHFKHLVFTGD